MQNHDQIDKAMSADAGATDRDPAGAGGAVSATNGDAPLLPQEIIDLIVLAVDSLLERLRIALITRSYLRSVLEKDHRALLHLVTKHRPDWNSQTVGGASAAGWVDVLTVLQRRQERLGLPCPVERRTRHFRPSYPMDEASKNGHVPVLQWWKESGLELKWSWWAMDDADRNGHVAVLEWWYESGLE